MGPSNWPRAPVFRHLLGLNAGQGARSVQVGALGKEEVEAVVQQPGRWLLEEAEAGHSFSYYRPFLCLYHLV